MLCCVPYDADSVRCLAQLGKPIASVLKFLQRKWKKVFANCVVDLDLRLARVSAGAYSLCGASAPRAMACKPGSTWSLRNCDSTASGAARTIADVAGASGLCMLQCVDWVLGMGCDARWGCVALTHANPERLPQVLVCASCSPCCY